MYLVQILLPLYTNEPQLFPDDALVNVRETLTERFGGVTAYQRSPALGHWKQTDVVIVRDDIVVFEVMLANCLIFFLWRCFPMLLFSLLKFFQELCLLLWYRAALIGAQFALENNDRGGLTLRVVLPRSAVKENPDHELDAAGSEV